MPSTRFMKAQSYRSLPQDEKDEDDPRLLEADKVRICQDSPSFKSLFYVLLTTNVTAVLLVGIGLLLRRDRILGDHVPPVGVFPPVNTHPRVFTPNESFYKALDDGHQIAWDSLIPDGSGFVRIDNPQSYGLSGGYPLSSRAGVNSESYCVSVFHQLHCLNSIKQQLENPHQPHQAHGDDHLDPHASELHVAHCLDYLRQSVMCCGDMSLEGAVMDPNGKLQHSVNGWDVTHSCKVWGEVFNYTERINTWNKE